MPVLRVGIFVLCQAISHSSLKTPSSVHILLSLFSVLLYDLCVEFLPLLLPVDCQPRSSPRHNFAVGLAKCNHWRMLSTTWHYTGHKKETMGFVATTKSPERDPSKGWGWRMILGVGLIALSLRGIAICQGIFETFIAPNPSPIEANSVKLAAAAAWFLFFGPILLAGVAAIWFGLRRLGALDSLAAGCEGRTARDFALPHAGKPMDSSILVNEENSHDRLETLSAGEVARLTARGNRIAVFLGLSAGAFLVLIGVFGLTLVATSPLRYSGTISFAIASGICILAGLTLLQRTVRPENNAWLLPLKLFTHLVLQKWRLSSHHEKPRKSEDLR